jgi:hypothetical protein
MAWNGLGHSGYGISTAYWAAQDIGGYEVIAKDYNDSNKRFIRIMEPRGKYAGPRNAIIAWDNGTGKFEKSEVRGSKKLLERFMNPESYEAMFKDARETGEKAK